MEKPPKAFVGLMVSLLLGVGSDAGQGWLQISGYKSGVVQWFLGFVSLLSFAVALLIVVVVYIWPSVSATVQRVRFQFPVRLDATPAPRVTSALQSESPLEISFDDSDQFCVDVVTEFATIPAQFLRATFRVAVRNNHSSTAVGEVRVLLERFEPGRAQGEIPLRFLLDRSEDGASSVRGYDLDPSVQQYVNVVSWNPRAEQHADQFMLAYALPRVENMVPLGTYRFDLVARGRGVEPFRRQFNLYFDKYGIPRFQPAVSQR